VIIHDAARPLVDEESVLAVANAAFEHGVRITSSLLFLSAYGCLTHK